MAHETTRISCSWVVLEAARLLEKFRIVSVDDHEIRFFAPPQFSQSLLISHKLLLIEGERKFSKAEQFRAGLSAFEFSVQVRLPGLAQSSKP